MRGMYDAPAIVVLTERGLSVGLAIQAVLPCSKLYGLATRVSGAEHTFTDLNAQLGSLFRSGHAVIGVCAAGILVRALAPLLADKSVEPPVLAIAEDGRAVIPLLGGHQGANALAERIANALGSIAAITTAGDTRFGVALDAPPDGWQLANPEHYKDFVARLLAGEACRVRGEAPWLEGSALPLADDAALEIHISEHRVQGSDTVLVYHPARLTVGVGCERGIDGDELCKLATKALDAQNLARASVAGVFSIDLKSDEAAVHSLGELLGVPVRFLDAATLEAQTPRLANPSEQVFEAVGCHGVAEGAALAAAGPDSELLVAKLKSRRATCAIARASSPIDVSGVGTPRGTLAVVGIGPGASQWRTPEASIALDAAQHIVGFAGYLQLLPPFGPHQTAHPFAIGEEEDRVRKALALASEGRAVALVSSGDAGIYAMAALVFEVLEREACAQWRRVAVRVVPGISALQAAAARVGAPLGHDFCAISLSDLLTPWKVIEARLEAAARGDFVVALYNPASRRRTHQLARAARILSAHRAPGTPVVIARNLGREAEAVDIIELARLGEKKVDMLSLVLIGASTTRLSSSGTCVYTPRGYGQKPKPEAAA